MIAEDLYKPDGYPVYYEKNQTIHACSGAEVHRGIVLLWTLCKMDIPANAAFRFPSSQGLKHHIDTVTCQTCREAFK